MKNSTKILTAGLTAGLVLATSITTSFAASITPKNETINLETIKVLQAGKWFTDIKDIFSKLKKSWKIKIIWKKLTKEQFQELKDNSIIFKKTKATKLDSKSKEKIENLLKKFKEYKKSL